MSTDPGPAEEPGVEILPPTPTQQLLDALEGAAVLVDRARAVVVDANATWRQRDRSMSIGCGLRDSVERGFGGALWEAVACAWEDSHRSSAPTALRTADGKWRLRVSAVGSERQLLQLTEARRPAQFSGTEHSLAEQVTALTAELARLHEAYDFAGVGFWRLEVETGTIWWSDETYRIHGREPGDLPPLEEAINHYAPEARTTIQRAVEAGVADLTPWDLELPFLQKDGTRIWVRTTGRAQRVGAGTVLFGAFSDISEKKVQEAEARRRDEKLASVVNGSHDGHWDWDLESNEVWYSPRYEELLGYSPGELTPSIESFADLLHPEDREMVFAAVQRHIETRVPYENEHRLLCKDGSFRWFRARGQAVWEDDGRAIRMSGATTDITIQVTTLSELEEARRSAEEASQSKSEFLANMSHEIRTPMAAILGFADLLTDPSISRQEVAPHVETIRRNGEHLLELINDILDLSKIEAGRLEVETVATSIRSEVQTVLDLMRVRANEKGLELAARFDPGIPHTIPSDPLRLRQVLTNLVGNAIKFTAEGHVRIEVDYDADRRAVAIGVEDSGIGIAEADQEHLFGAFCQADSSTTRRFGGTGLGLTISQRLAGLLGGSIHLSSKPGVGSRFTLELILSERDPQELDHPRAPLPAPRTQARGRPRAGTLEGRQVLVVDDGADNRKLLSIHLRRAGATVETLENGRLALEWMRAARASNALPDLVLMDMQMPEMDGYEATSILRREGFDLPILAVTAHAMAGDDRHCLDAGCNGYVAKPVDFAQLLKTVGEHLAQSSRHPN
ncbi:MAG: PAS domain-containing protein [Planctomycetota bacterium]